MNPLRDLLARLTLRQKLTAVAAALASLALIWLLVHWNRERDFKPLYTGLSPEDAGAVIARLRETGVDYRVTDGGASILVPSAKVAEIRLQLAAAGIPRSGRIGFELFDKQNFGLSDFTEHLNYQRALEGELERSIRSMAEVEQARVHLTFAKDSVFVESRQPAKASVMLRLRRVSQLPPQAIAAITHLVASAVEGLTPENIAVVDMRGNLLNRPRHALHADSEAGEAALEYRQKLEKDLVAKIIATLEPVLGPERFRAAASIDCDLTSGEQSEEVFDPNRSVMVTSQKTEDISGSALASGVPGTPSNLPRPTSRPGQGTTGTSRRTESIQYQSTRSVRRLKIPQGIVKRVSVTVLVDQDVRWEGSGPKARRVFVPPPAERLKIIRDLVAGVMGFQQERGDQIIVESLPFENAPQRLPGPADSSPQTGPALPLPKWLADLLGQNPTLLAIAGGGALLVLLLLALVLFLLLRKRKKPKPTLTVENVQKAIAPAQDPAQLQQEIRKEIEHKIAEQAAEKEQQKQDILRSLKLPPVTTQKAEVLGKQIADETKKDPQTIAHIVRSWLAER